MDHFRWKNATFDFTKRRKKTVSKEKIRNECGGEERWEREVKRKARKERDR